MSIDKDNRDIMGYPDLNKIWISDRTFAQWSIHLNSKEAVGERPKQKLHVINTQKQEKP